MNDTDKERLRQNAAAMLAHADGKPVQQRYSDNTNEWMPFDGGWTAPLGAWDYRPAPEPVSRRWSSPADVPGPVVWLRILGQDRLITAIHRDGITVGSIYRDLPETTVSWVEFEQQPSWEYSTDRRNWQPCTVVEP
jgi:hypothetical protein